MPESPQPPSMQISTEIAQIYKAHYGRGPTKITAHQLPDAVVCLLEDVNTPIHDALLTHGQEQLAQSVHGQLQMAMADQMREVVERLTGRTVRGYVPGFNTAINATTDVFYLEPTTP